jgi:hypothetical protein
MPIVSMPGISMALIDRPPIVAARVPMLAVVLRGVLLPLAIVVLRMPTVMAIAGKRRACPYKEDSYPGDQ